LVYDDFMKNLNGAALRILFISNGIFVFANTLLGPLYAIFAEKFDSNILSVSFSWFLYMISTTVFTLIVMKYGDKIREKEYLLIIGFLIRIISWILYIFTTNIYMFLSIQILLGLGDAIGSPAFDSILSKHIDCGAEISEFSTWKLVMSFSVAIATLVGGFIVYYLSFNVLFVLMALLGTIAVLIVYFQPRKLL
jgi:MFS family permease